MQYHKMAINIVCFMHREADDTILSHVLGLCHRLIATLGFCILKIASRKQIHLASCVSFSLLITNLQVRFLIRINYQSLAYL